MLYHLLPAMAVTLLPLALTIDGRLLFLFSGKRCGVLLAKAKCLCTELCTYVLCIQDSVLLGQGCFETQAHECLKLLFI